LKHGNKDFIEDHFIGTTAMRVFRVRERLGSTWNIAWVGKDLLLWSRVGANRWNITER
jgi:hypothetical protein